MYVWVRVLPGSLLLGTNTFVELTHLFEKMGDTHCVRDNGATANHANHANQGLARSDWLRVRARVRSYSSRTQ